MTKQIAFLLIIMLRIIYHPSHDQDRTNPFAKLSPLSTSTISADPAKTIIHRGTTDKRIMKWVLGDNSERYCFAPVAPLHVKELYKLTGNYDISVPIQLMNSIRLTEAGVGTGTNLFINSKNKYNV